MDYLFISVRLVMSWLVVGLYLPNMLLALPNFTASERECPTRVIPGIFYYSDSVPYGVRGRAYSTVPPGFLLRRSSVPGAGLGVYSTGFLRKHTWLGEYQGDFLSLNASNSISRLLAYSWIVNVNGHRAYHVDAGDLRSSNWLRFMNCARHVTEQTVADAACYGRIYYRTVRDVAPGTELLVYYGDRYAAFLGIDHKNYFTKNYDFRSQSKLMP